MATPSLSIESIAQEHKEVILRSVTEKYGHPAAELKLLPQESFASTSEPGNYCFMVLHASGFYGVYGTTDGKGALKAFTTTEL